MASETSPWQDKFVSAIIVSLSIPNKAYPLAYRMRGLISTHLVHCDSEMFNVDSPVTKILLLVWQCTTWNLLCHADIILIVHIGYSTFATLCISQKCFPSQLSHTEIKCRFPCFSISSSVRLKVVMVTFISQTSQLFDYMLIDQSAIERKGGLEMMNIRSYYLILSPEKNIKVRSGNNGLMVVFLTNVFLSLATNWQGLIKQSCSSFYNLLYIAPILKSFPSVALIWKSKCIFDFIF